MDKSIFIKPYSSLFFAISISIHSNLCGNGSCFLNGLFRLYILSNFAADNPKMVNEMKQSATPEDLSNENLELKKRLAALEKELHEAKMAAAAYDKMIDIAERLYKIPVRKKSGPKQ